MKEGKGKGMAEVRVGIWEEVSGVSTRGLDSHLPEKIPFFLEIPSFESSQKNFNMLLISI